MSTPQVNPLAGKPAPASLLTDIPRLLTAYFSLQPDVTVPNQQVAFGTSGHRGSAFDYAFNEWHVLAISQAICEYRKQQGIDGPLFLGIDTHAVSPAASASAVEVLAANGVEVMLAERDEYTPTPAVSHAIVVYNRGRKSGLADGISFGRKFISNPDLVERFRTGAELAPDNFKTWYTPGPEGYSDYPALQPAE